MSSVSAEGEQTVKLLLLVGLFHVLYLVNVILADDLHHLERLTLCAENRSALSENARKSGRSHVLAKVVDESVVTV